MLFLVNAWDCHEILQQKNGIRILPDSMPDGFSLERVPHECPRWTSEVPEGSFVGVLHTAACFQKTNGLQLSLNLMGVLVLALPPDH